MLKIKGGHSPKAGPKKKRLKSEADKLAQAVEANTTTIKKATRKAGKVREYSYKQSSGNGRRVKRITEAELLYLMRQPKGLSLEAQWMEERVLGWCPLDWYELFDADKELWPYIIEIARYEHAN